MLTSVSPDILTPPSPTASDYQEAITVAIARAERRESKLTAFHMVLDGMSSFKGRHLLNGIVGNVAEQLAPSRLRYLEVGTWKGSTLCSATFSNDVEAVAIDNFSQFIDISLGGRDPRHPREAVMKNMALNRLFSKPQADTHILDNDAFAVDPTGLGLFDVYLYDGEHTYDAHYKAFIHFAPALQPLFVTIVDDYRNLPEDGTHQATQQAFKDLGWKVTAEWFLHEECDGTDAGRMENGWWNGMYIAVVSKQ